LQAEGDGHAKFVVAGAASAYLLPAMKINPLPAGFIVPAQSSAFSFSTILVDVSLGLPSVASDQRCNRRR
jgi:hypothetical protein